MLAGAHKKFYPIQHPEIYLLDLKIQYKHKIKLPLGMVSKHVFLYLCLPDYNVWIKKMFIERRVIEMQLLGGKGTLIFHVKISLFTI